MFYRDNSRIPYAAWIVLAMSAILLLPWLGEAWFSSKGEPREALVAVAILEQSDWVLPVNFGTDIPYKPPLLAWLIAALAAIFNGGVVNEYISRLPSALAAIALVMAGFDWSRRERGDRFAVVFSIVTLTCFEVFRAAMACRVDMVLTAAMVIPMYLIFRVDRNLRKPKNPMSPKNPIWLLCLAAVLVLSCAVLTKGPVGSLLPCAAMGVYLLLRRRPFWASFASMLGLALAAMILPALWYYAAWLRGGDGFLDLVLEENIGRLTGNMGYASHEQPFWYNFVTLLAGCLPWTLAVLMAATVARRLRRTPLQPAGLLALVAAVVIVGFYCIPASKRSVYLLPAYPFVCYAIASVLDSPLARRPVRAFAWLVSVLAVLAPVVFIVLLTGAVDIVPLTMPHWYGMVMLAAPLATGASWFVHRHSPLGHTLVAVWALYLAYIACIMPAVTNSLSDRRLLESLPQQQPVLCLPAPAVGNSVWRPYTLDFYLRDGIRLVDTWDEAAAAPAGTAVIAPADIDTTGMRGRFRVDTLTMRSCDSRRPMVMGVVK